jgi:alanine racemase
MDLITLNLGEIPDARVGDEVILWGTGLPVENLARKAGTIPYELLCGVTQRVAMRLV